MLAIYVINYVIITVVHDSENGDILKCSTNYEFKLLRYIAFIKPFFKIKLMHGTAFVYWDN